MLSKVAFVGLFLTIIRQSSANDVFYADAGTLANLTCPSSQDRLHVFQYWTANDNLVIGPGNKFNDKKFKFEAWSGQLLIKEVSIKEAGVYNCISKHVSNEELVIRPVQLVVSRDFETVYEEDPNTNTFRAAVAVLVLLIVIILGIFFYFARQRRTRNFTDLAREESPDEGISSRGPQRAYNPTTTELPSTSRASRALDNAIVETDIKTSFALTDYP